MYNFENIDDVYFSKTREYLNEVISSYSNGNYRSANVMLYSVVLCDLLLKLRDLSDMYDDKIATEILSEYEKSIHESEKRSKSGWEYDLIESIEKKTSLLDDEDRININHLRDHRNISAHPALNSDYDLISPTKESTAANIKNAIKIFIKPPIFVKKVFDMLTEELSDKKELFRGDREGLERLLNKKYYDRMPDKMKYDTVKSFWKLCFKSPNDEKCSDNRSINRCALTILVNRLPSDLYNSIKEEQDRFTVSQDDNCIAHLILFISDSPSIYNALSSETKKSIDNYTLSHPNYLFISWFKFDACEKHINALRSVSINNPNDIFTKKLLNHYSAIGNEKIVLDYYIDLYGKSVSFNMSDNNYQKFIEPNIERFSRDQIIKLIEYSNENDQLYNNWNIRSYIGSIISKSKDKVGSDFDYSQYKNLESLKCFITDGDLSDDSEE